MTRVLWMVFVIFSGLNCNKSRTAAQAFPLPDCWDTNIDLLLVAHKVSDNFQPQLRFFSLLIEVFLGTDHVDSQRLKVAMITYTVSSVNGIQFQEVFDYSKYFNKTKAKDFIMTMSYDAVNLDPDILNIRLNTSNATVSNAYNVTSTNTSLKAIFELREDAQQVTVFVVEQSQLDLFLEADLKMWSGDSKLFYVIIDDPFYDSPIRLEPNCYVRIKSYTSLEFVHNIPYGLCSTCYPEWFGFDQSNVESLVWTFSCYNFIYNERRIAWSDALKLCEQKHSTLVALETPEELEFLRPMMVNITNNLWREHFGDSQQEKLVQIGLSRDRDSLAKRFRWVNKAPLTTTHWNNYVTPNGGYVQSCGAWDIKSDPDFDWWDDFGCGYRNAFFYICEADVVAINYGYDSASTVKETKLERVHSAINRGELARCNKSETLVSVSRVMGQIQDTGCFLGSDNMTTSDLSQKVALFDCENLDKTSIAYSFVCDYKVHCPNGRDEQVCRYRKCKPDEFTCSSKQCVPADARCDLYKDCFDGSDEINCLDCRFTRCQDGSCLPNHWWYDEEVDCIWGDFNIGYTWDLDPPLEEKNGQCAFMCNRTQCVTKTMLNNGKVDCTGPEGPLDETIGALEATTCYPNDPNSKMWAPRCVYYRDRYDSPLGCRTMLHLKDCQYFICPAGYVKCPESYCIPMHQAHDGKQDCPMGEDELNEFFPDCKKNFLCMGSSVCVYVDQVCDGYPHCPEGDDELNCNMSCSPGFRCIGGTVTVDNYDRSKPLMSLNFMDPRIRYLDLSGVILSELLPNLPLNLFLSNLNVLLLSGCGITGLDNQYLNSGDNLRQDWLELSGVHTMDLSHNNIEYISEQSIIKTMYNLRVLSLSHNNLKKIDAKAFELLGFSSSIESLDLSLTEITTTFKVLDPLVNLKYLNLSSTPLADLKPGTFPSEGGVKLQVLDLRSVEISYFYPDTFKGLAVSTGLYTDTYRLCCPQVRGPDIDSDICHAPNDPLSTCADLMGDEFKRVLLWLAGLLAVIGNIVVVVYRIRWTRQLLKKAYGMFVVHLAISDVIMGIYLLIIASADVYYRNVYIWHEMQWRSSALCQIAGFASLLSSEVSACFIFFITVDRFLVLKYPFSNVKLSKRITFIICSLVWLVGFAIAVIPLFPKFKHWGTYSSNGMCLGLPLTSKRLPGWQFSSIVFIGFNSILFILIAIGQFSIYRTMAAANKQQRAICGTTDARQQQDFAVARQLFLVAISNFLCWFPIGVMGLVSLGGYEIGLAAFAWSTVLVMPINSALNPVLYTIPALMQKISKSRNGSTSATKRSTTQQVCLKCQATYKMPTKLEEIPNKH